MSPSNRTWIRSWPLLLAGPFVACLVFLLFRKFVPEAPPSAGWTLLVTVWMAIWWMTEAVPLEATALLPILALPALGVQSIAATTAEYSDPNVFLYLGGIGIAFGIEKTGLHRRGALAVLNLAGSSSQAIIGGFMLVTALLSMWISNTAAAILMLPLVRSVIQLAEVQTDGSPRSSRALAGGLLLGVGYAASLGGMGTLVGTPTNVFFRGFMEEQGLPVSFFGWMQMALPLVAVMFVMTWLLVTQVFFREARQVQLNQQWLRSARTELPAWTAAEYWALAVFSLAAGCWTFRESLASWSWLATAFPGINRIHDAMIAMGGLLLLLCIPVPVGAPREPSSAPSSPASAGWRPLLNWEDMQKSPWGILLLLGGGLSLAKAIQTSGLSEVIASGALSLKGIPEWLLLLIVISAVVFLSELASNVATATTVIPILAGIAQGLQLSPEVFAMPAVLAASCGFMLPVATPPNAIVFGERKLTLKEMMQVGLLLDLACIVVIWVFAVLRLSSNV